MRRREFIILFLSIIFFGELSAQQMTLSQAIEIAQNQSVQALEAKSEFISAYWQYRSYKASMLPSINLYGDFMSYDRSLTLLQDFSTGEMKYAKSYHLQNRLGLSVVQNIPLTGGTVSLFSDLSRIDQFGDYKSTTWYSQPITLNYNQSLFSYNSFKWSKLISPKEYEQGKRKYLEQMEQISESVVKCFFDLLFSKVNHDVTLSNYENTLRLHSIATERMKLGRVTKDELLKLEINILKDSININEAEDKMREAQMKLNSILGYDESNVINPISTEELPEIKIDYLSVIDKSMENSSFAISNELELLNADSEVARAKASRGLSMSLFARLGLTKDEQKLRKVYSNPLDQEVVGVTFTIPIFDWGLGYGRVQKAKAARDASKAKVQQAENDYRRNIYMSVGKFNNQRRQCMVSKKAQDLAVELYNLMIEKFRTGKATVTELIDSQTEKDSAIEKYITDITAYWTYYYEIRRLTLFDFIENKDITVDFDDLLR